MDSSAALEAVLAQQQQHAHGARPSGVTGSGRLRLILGVGCYVAAVAAATFLANGPFSYCRLEDQPPSFSVPKGMDLAVALALTVLLCLALPALVIALSAFTGASTTSGCGGLLAPRSVGCITLAALALGAVVAVTWPLLAVLRCKGGLATTTSLPDTLLWVSMGLASAVAAALAHYAWLN